jgi:hypothetical protein
VRRNNGEVQFDRDELKQQLSALAQEGVGETLFGFYTPARTQN